VGAGLAPPPCPVRAAGAAIRPRRRLCLPFALPAPAGPSPCPQHHPRGLAAAARLPALVPAPLCSPLGDAASSSPVSCPFLRGSVVSVRCGERVLCFSPQTVPGLPSLPACCLAANLCAGMRGCVGRSRSHPPPHPELSLGVSGVGRERETWGSGNNESVKFSLFGFCSSACLYPLGLIPGIGCQHWPGSPWSPFAISWCQPAARAFL